MIKFASILLCLFIAKITNSQIIDFTSDISKGCAPISINFQIINNTTNSYNYQWFFGNGNSSTLINPKALYSNPDVYDVLLVVYDGNTAIDTIRKDNYIKVFENPKANFWTTTSRQGCVPLQVGFINNSLTNDTIIVENIWTFGDGSMSYDINPNFTYNLEGLYNVSLKILDANGCEDTKFYQNLIKTSNLPKVNFNSNIQTSCDTPTTINFNNLTTSSFQTTNIWNFSNGITSNELNPLVNYIQFGTYNVALTVIDAHGCSNSLIKTNYINIGEIKSHFIVTKDSLDTISNDKFCKYETLFFKNNSSIAKYSEWNFGDNTYSNLLNPKHKYSSSGTYIVKLKTYNDSNCFDVFIDTIYIDKVKASFVSNGEYICSNPASVSYTNNSQFASNYLWIFGNRDTSTSVNPVNEFTNNIQQIKLTDTLIAYSIYGCADTIFYSDNLIFNIPKAYFTPNNSSEFSTLIKGCIPFNVNFNNLSIYNTTVDSIISYSWNFGNSNFSSLASPSETYNNVGEYEVKMILTTARGCIAEYKALVKTGTIQQASFITQGNTNVCASTPVQFINTSQDQSLINEWNWTFSDGTISKEKNPLHYFNALGTLSVILIVGYNGCMSTAYTMVDAVSIKGPIGSFTFDFSCDSQYHYNFNANLQGATRWFWEFGDGSKDSSGLTNVSYDYTYSNDYLIVLNAFNDSNSCSFMKQNIISVRNVKSEFLTDTLIGCTGLNVNFFTDSCNDEDRLFLHNYYYYYYKWNIDNSPYYIYSNDDISKKFNTIGEHLVKLEVKGVNSCIKEYSKKIKTYKPLVNFSFATTSLCAPFTVNFLPNIQSDTTYSVLWTFSDDTISRIENAIHKFQQPGKYSVSLQVRDTLSCTTKITKDSIINAIRTKPDFTVSKQNTCIGNNIEFYNKIDIDSLSYHWSFGDGTYSNERRPVHSYNNQGNYNVSLKLSFTSGCDSTLEINDFIKVQNFPIADFSTDTTFSDCYPFLVRFSDNSSYSDILNYNWNFGDNQISIGTSNPTHSYIVPGNFDVSLIVSSDYGCSDTLTKLSHINVGGPYAEIRKPEIICKGLEFNYFIDNKINITNFNWDLGDGNFASGDTIGHTYTQNGIIYPSLILFSDTMYTCNKVIKDSVFIKAITADFNIKDSAKCVYTPIIFTDSSVGATDWTWKINNSSFSNFQNTNYIINESGWKSIKLIAKNEFACKDSLIKSLYVNPLPTIKISNDTIICKGDYASLNASGGEIYRWTPTTNLNYSEIYNPLANPENNIVYQVEVIDNKQCTDFKSVFVKVQQVPEITISKDTAIIIGEVVNLIANSQQNASYFWEPNIGLSCNICQNTLSSPMNSTEYTLTVIDSMNCFSVTDKVFIDIIKKYTIDVPTLFTPNDDGINDIITPRGWGIHMISDFRVFNKWGEVVFQSNEKNIGWNGYYKGKLQENDTYVYYVEAITYEGKKISKKGNFVLMK